MKKPSATCLHCNQELLATQKKFCCLGCKTAYKIIKKGGFASYYQKRELQNSTTFNKPEEFNDFELEEFIEKNGEKSSITLMITGIHCAACIWLIENLLKAESAIIGARINLSQKTLFLSWKGEVKNGKDALLLLSRIGYKALPFNAQNLDLENRKEGEKLAKALAVAGFGAGNIMLFSFSLWFANSLQMGVATRQFLHLFSSIIALPTLVYSGRIFFISAIRSLKLGYPNMDLPISIAILLASIVSLFQAFTGGEHAYFDSAVMLVFFLLIGRYLEFKARKKAFNIAAEFTLLAASFGRVEENGKISILNVKNLKPEMILLVAAGEKIAGDGLVIEGESSIDNSLVSGESLPKPVKIGSQVFAGTINLSAPLRIKITAKPEENLIAQIAKLITRFEGKKGHFVRLADRWSKIYTPAVHLLALLTFLSWLFLLDNSWQEALMKATAVLVITCPCALALAVPITQTIAISSLIKRGIIVKNGEIFEKIHKIKTIIFDKTGTLTQGKPQLDEIFLITKDGLKELDPAQKPNLLAISANLAKHSKHPLSQAICQKFDEINKEQINKTEFFISEIREIPGSGIKALFNSEEIRLGERNFCGIDFDQNLVNQQLQASLNGDAAQILKCFMIYGNLKLIFTFCDQLKSDAASTIKQLQSMGKRLILLSGDEIGAVERIAKQLGIAEFYGQQSPTNKAEFLENLLHSNQETTEQTHSSNQPLIDEPKFTFGEKIHSKAKFEQSENLSNLKVLMIGDGVNDAPSLALADVSLSFSTGADLTQNVADVVICGDKLQPLLDGFIIANRTLQLMRQNLQIALIYNLFAVPFAVLGLVSPLIAALAMSTSSILVLLNAARLR